MNRRHFQIIFQSMFLNMLFLPFYILPIFAILPVPFVKTDANEIVEQGRNQYQLLRERGQLPRYGPCWKSALEAVDEGCRDLTEEVQSDIALALTNCFLDMSGLEIYSCDTDKKLNVRQICISSMSDRAFNVYTEFYTHALNMCWFLRGQIWQETISENTQKVGQQLRSSIMPSKAYVLYKNSVPSVGDGEVRNQSVVFIPSSRKQSTPVTENKYNLRSRNNTPIL